MEPTICVAESGPRRNRKVEGEAAVLWTLSVYLADRVYTRLPACAWRLLDSERFEGVPVSFFPSDASWLSPGRSTRSIACCRDE